MIQIPRVVVSSNAKTRISMRYSDKWISLGQASSIQYRNFAVGSKAKKKKKKQNDSSDDPSIKGDPELQMVIRCLDTPQPPKPNLTDEQKSKHFEIGRNYVIGNFKQHNEIRHDLACKIKLKNHAKNLLPRNTMWKEEALKIDSNPDSFAPYWRPIPTDYPPISGFNVDEFLEKEK